jgi:hypothetical protein
MTGTVLEQRLRIVITRLKRLRILRRQTVSWLLLLLPAIVVALWLPVSYGLFRLDLFVLLGATILGTVLSRLTTKQPSLNEAARLVEQTHSELNDAIVTAVHVSERPGKRPSVLSAMVVQEADCLAGQSDWTRVVSGGSLAAWTLLSVLSFAVMVSSVMAASRYGRNLAAPSNNTTSVARNQQFVPITELLIEPGDIEIECGSALTVVAEFPVSYRQARFWNSSIHKRSLGN